MVSFSKRITSGTDDAEEAGYDGTGTHTNGYVDLNSSDIELGEDQDTGAGYRSGHQTVGLRFTGVTIPKGWTIASAHLTFRAISADTNNSNSQVTSLTIKGEKVANALTFTSTPFNVTDRILTTASANWTPGTWLTGTDYDSVSLIDIIQEIVNQGTWASGNALALIISGSGHRSTYSYDSTSRLCSQLNIKYEEPVIGWPSGKVNTISSTNIGKMNSILISSINTINTI